MQLLTDLAIGILGGIITLFFQWLWERFQEKSGAFTGNWEQLIYNPENPEILEKKDFVECRQQGRIVHAKIVRSFPKSQKGREWTFIGRYARGTVFGHFWSKNKPNPSFGTIFLRQTQDDQLKGFYTRYHHIVEDWEKDSLTITRIPLEWHKINS